MKEIFKILISFVLLVTPLSAEEIKVFEFTKEELSTLEVRKVRGADSKTQYFLGSNENGNFLKAVASLGNFMTAPFGVKQKTLS